MKLEQISFGFFYFFRFWCCFNILFVNLDKVVDLQHHIETISSNFAGFNIFNLQYNVSNVFGLKQSSPHQDINSNT